METTQTGIRFPNDLLEKIKYIAWFDRRTITNTVVIAMEEHVEQWESENEPITPAMLKKVKK